MRPNAWWVQCLVGGLAVLWPLAPAAQEPAAGRFTWDQEKVSDAALELDAILASASLAPAAPSEEDTPNAARGADQVERLAADMEELAIRLTAGEDREATRELMSRIENRMALLAQMGVEAPVIASPEDAAAAAEAWSELRAYYKGRGPGAEEVEASDGVVQ